MHILSLISDTNNQPVSIKEIALKTGYPKPTCSRILDTLFSDGFAVRVSQTKGYILGPSIYNLTRYGRYKEDLVYLCKPVMRWMERNAHATVVLAVIQSKQKFIIDYFDTEQNLISEHLTIRKDDIYRTATGRAILAYMDREQVKEIWDKYGAPARDDWDEITSYEMLLDALKKVRQEEFVIAKSFGNSTIGYAYPIFRQTTCIGAIGIAWKPNALLSLHLIKPSG